MEEPEWDTELPLTDDNDVVSIVILDPPMIKGDHHPESSGSKLDTIRP